MARPATRAITLTALALMGCASLAPARAQDSERPLGFFDRIFTGSERFGAGEVAPAAGTAGAAGERVAQLSDSDLLVRLDRLEAQIRQLTGQIEQLQYRNQQLEAQLRGMQPGGVQQDGRIGDSGARGISRATPRAENLPPPSPPSAPPPAAGSAQRGDAFDPTQHPNAPGAPHTLGTMGAPS